MNFVYYITYYVVNMYLRKAPERFGGFYNADEVDMCDGNRNHIVPQEIDISSNNIQEDLDYTALGWGDEPSHLNYIGLIPYLIKSIQELHARIHTLENAAL
jgi:hypothetical protein